MREIGGYLELDKRNSPIMHEKAIALNSARNCLAYLIKAKRITRIVLPKFLCNSVKEICKREKVAIRYYSVNEEFRPVGVILAENEWLYFVNYYGQFDNDDLNEVVHNYKKVIVDNVQAYFQEPIKGIDTLYTCRKFFGVSDGAFIYTDARINENMERDESFSRMKYLLGRYERSATEFYSEHLENEKRFAGEPIKLMSKVTRNLLGCINYKEVKCKRTDNFITLHNEIKKYNRLKLKVPEGPFMYPLYVEDGERLRSELISKRIYVPMLWPEVLESCSESDLEYDMAKNILPLPIDQRYGYEDMQYIIEEVVRLIEKV